MTKIGIIGGSGLESLDLFTSKKELDISTKYGKPSSSLFSGQLNGKEIVIISRHGRNHAIPPTQVNNRANITALKELGCTHILATTACGSLRDEIKRGDLVIPDQFIDFTRHRIVTFHEVFEHENLAHTPMSDPFNKDLCSLIHKNADLLGYANHPKGTVITIEGPRFSSRAESNMFRLWGADIINMSTAPETILANEAGIPYAAIAVSTDYDCWKKDEKPVTWEEVFHIFKQNVEKVTKLIVQVIQQIQ